MWATHFIKESGVGHKGETLETLRQVCSLSLRISALEAKRVEAKSVDAEGAANDEVPRATRCSAGGRRAHVEQVRVLNRSADGARWTERRVCDWERVPLTCDLAVVKCRSPPVVWMQHFGYSPTILYPKRTSRPLFQGLVTQCQQLEIPFVDQVATADAVDTSFDLIVDGIFGFSFEGSIRAPFDDVISTLKQCQTPIVSIDIPSGWHVEKGNESGVGLEPQMLISLTAPKLCAQHFSGPDKTHYIGGRFVPRSLAEAFGLELPQYPGTEQCVKLQ
ncbi:Yjef family domain-containing protein, partial [Globisporangium splendens]